MLKQGRIPDTTMQCIRYIRETYPELESNFSVEVERPGRAGLKELAAEADVVFFSKSLINSIKFQEPATVLESLFSSFYQIHNG